MIANLTYKYYRKENAKEVFVLLQGGRYKIETPLMTNLFEALITKGQNVFAFNFPESNHGENSDNENDLSSEIESLNTVVNYLKNKGNEKFYFVAKSLGGIVASRWLEKYPDQDLKMSVLGFVVGQLSMNGIRGRLDIVVQGEHDRFGDAKAAEEHLKENNINAKVTEIPGADHSYNNLNKEPEFQQLAVETLIKNL